MATISISLANPKPLWSPGDTIIGEVHLQIPMAQEDVQSITVTLKGKSKAKYVRRNGGQNNSTTTYRSKVTIFRLIQTLFQGPFTISHTRMSWPFEFVIPTDCRYSEGDVFNIPGQFDSSSEQPLPPTFTSGGYSLSCEISYALEATMNTNHTFSRHKECLYPLIIAPKRTAESTDYQRFVGPQRFIVRSLHLDPDTGSRSLTFRETMRTAFKSESLPQSTFVVAVDLPEAAVMFEDIRPVMLLDHLVEKSTSKHLPVVNLVSLKVMLNYNVFLRTTGGWHGYIDNDFPDSMEVGRWSGKVPLSERFEISNLFPNGLTVHGTPPTFRTFNVALIYGWRFKYTVECATKRLDGECSRGCIILGPERMNAIAPASGPWMQASQPPPPPMNGDFDLPQYSKID